MESHVPAVSGATLSIFISSTISKSLTIKVVLAKMKFVSKQLAPGLNSMIEAIINKTMDRSDLFTNDALPIIQKINELIETLYSKNLYMTSWYGSLPPQPSKCDVINFINKLLGKAPPREEIGMDNRGPEYEALPGSADDRRIPWYLYWEIVWVMINGPKVTKHMRLLDAGGASSLFSCYLSSLGCEVHSIDINASLISNAKRLSETMGWNLHSYEMDMQRLDFKNDYFDHAYSICVFEHLDYEIKLAALSEIARCLKKDGTLSITFDYKNPAPYIAGYGPDTLEKNQISNREDIRRSFLSTERFKILGNQEFHDNGDTYLVHPQLGNAPYTFGAIFLEKIE